jgi:hypothetical protein
MKDINNIKNELIDAKKHGDKIKDSCLGVLISKLQNERIKLGRDLVQAEQYGVVRKCIKETEESLRFAVENKREDLVVRLNTELIILNEYVPKELDVTAIEKIVLENIGEEKNKGKIMKIVSPILRGQANMAVVSQIVDKIIQEG